MLDEELYEIEAETHFAMNEIGSPALPNEEVGGREIEWGLFIEHEDLDTEPGNEVEVDLDDDL